MDARDIYTVIGDVPRIEFFGLGTQLPIQTVMTCRPNTGAGGGCYLYSSKLVCIRVG